MAASHSLRLQGGCSAVRGAADHACSLWGRRARSRSCRLELRRQRFLPVRACARPEPEFGARDPFPEELASNFADNVLGHSDTDHVILLPNSPALGLAQRSCALPVPPGTSAFAVDEARAFLRKIIGWRLVDEQSGLKLQCEWKLKDHEAGLELQNRILAVSKVGGKSLELELDDQTNILRADLWTDSIGGLCENDFIMAAKIDKIRTTDLIKKARFWA